MSPDRRKRKRDRARKLVSARSQTARTSRAFRANERGESVPPTVEGYSEAASRGETHVAEALIARHNRRMVATASIPEYVQAEILSALVPICHLDMAAQRLGADIHRHPCDRGGSILDNMAWGLDSAVAICRLLLCGQVAGAAALARNQLEAWTTSRAQANNLTKRPGEADSAFIARVWSATSAEPMRLVDDLANELTFDEDESGASCPEFPHKHVSLKSGQRLCPAASWISFSELLHCRAHAEAFTWDADCLPVENTNVPERAIFTVLDGVRLSLFHIRSVLLLISDSFDAAEVTRLLEAGIEEFSLADDSFRDSTDNCVTAVPPAAKLMAPPLMFMAPLMPKEGLSSSMLDLLQGASDSFEAVMRGERPIGRKYRDDELVTAAFGWHRLRSANAALQAINHEKQALQDEFNPNGLQDRATGWLFVTESISLLSQWCREKAESEVLAFVGSSLRASWWLWLEDDDRAMAVLRCTFEQIARLRVLRLKPTKAAKLESRSTPRDWIEAAGWRRLGPLNSALGEFSHLTTRSDWNRARALLTEIQEDADEESAPHTARRSAMELVTLLVAAEARERLAQYSDDLGNAVGTLFLQVGVTPVDETRYIEERLDHVYSFRPSSS